MFFNQLLPEYASTSQAKVNVFENKERSAESGEIEQIRVEFNSNVFRTTEDNEDLIEALSNMSRSSLTVYHRNPYAHLSILDFVDGSSCDVLVTEPDEVTLVPSYRGSRNSLMRVSEQISREFDEGSITDLGEPQFDSSEFFSN